MGGIVREDVRQNGSGSSNDDPNTKSGKFEDDFKVTGRLGSGAQAEVFECIHRYTREIQAVKIFQKRLPDGKREARYLRRLQSHPNIIGYKDCYESPDSVSLVMECGMMDLMEYALNHMVVPWDGRSNFPKLREGQLAHLAKGMARAVCHCHSQGFIHRDIKTTNFAMGCDGDVKLLDFGFAYSIKNGKFPKACVGTAEFWAPEVATKDQTYGTPADIFALGVTFYHLITGRLPDIKNLRKQQRQVIEGNREELRNVPALAQSLLKGMLQYSPKDRLTIIQVLQHPWLNENRNESIKLYNNFLYSTRKENQLPWLHGLWKNNQSSNYSSSTSKNTKFDQQVNAKQFSKDDSANIKGGYQIKNQYKNKNQNKNQQPIYIPPGIEATSGKKSPFYKVGKLAKKLWSKFSAKQQDSGCQGSCRMQQSPGENQQQYQQKYQSKLQQKNINKNSQINDKIKSKPLIYNQFLPMQMQGNELKVLLPPIFKGRNFKFSQQS